MYSQNKTQDNDIHNNSSKYNQMAEPIPNMTSISGFPVKLHRIQKLASVPFLCNNFWFFKLCDYKLLTYINELINQYWDYERAKPFVEELGSEIEHNRKNIA